MAGKIVLAVVLLFVVYACAEYNEECDCQCQYKKCKEHAKTHHEKNRCEEGLKICTTCTVTTCFEEAKECWVKAKTHKEQDACADQWFKCGRCFCRWDKCNEHATVHKEHNRCNVSVDICRHCNTHVCDVKAEHCHKAAKTHADIHKCIDAWQKCGLCECKYEACMAHIADKVKCAEGRRLCKRCDTKKCDAALDTCMASATTHEELHKCLDGWYTCVKEDCHK